MVLLNVEIYFHAVCRGILLRLNVLRMFLLFVHIPAEAECALRFFKIKEFTGGSPDLHHCDNLDYVFYFER